jgi:hypothetical protein
MTVRARTRTWAVKRLQRSLRLAAAARDDRRSMSGDAAYAISSAS